MTAEDRARIFREMAQSRCPIDELRQVAGPGIYAIFLGEGATLPGIEPGDESLLYIGETESLRERLHDTHFKSGQTGFSTLRRTIGALLKESLRLVAIPRGKGVKDRDLSLFKFRPNDEGRLTQWMAKSLRVAAQVGSDLQDEEPDFISQLEPPLNSQGWPNPNRERLEKLLNACRAEAHASVGSGGS